MGIIDSALQSVITHDCDSPIEAIVYDDGPTVGPVKYIRRNIPDVKLFESNTDVDFCTSNNRLVTDEKGPPLTIMVLLTINQLGYIIYCILKESVLQPLAII